MTSTAQAICQTLLSRSPNNSQAAMRATTSRQLISVEKSAALICDKAQIWSSAAPTSTTSARAAAHPDLGRLFQQDAPIVAAEQAEAYIEDDQGEGLLKIGCCTAKFHYGNTVIVTAGLTNSCPLRSTPRAMNVCVPG